MLVRPVVREEDHLAGVGLVQHRIAQHHDTALALHRLEPGEGIMGWRARPVMLHAGGFRTAHRAAWPPGSQYKRWLYISLHLYSISVGDQGELRNFSVCFKSTLVLTEWLVMEVSNRE